MLDKLNWKAKRDTNTLITYTNPKSIISEEFNTLRTNIQFATANKPSQTLMFTSANKNEGKSTVIANVAMTFANQGKKVLLVDSDMRNPSLHVLFHIENRRGLTDLLTDRQISVSSLCQPTPHANLSILPSGALPPNPSELIDSERMDEVLALLKQEFQLILFDMPPIIAVTDAQVMAAKVDGTVFVIRSGVTEKKQLLKAKELLEYAQATIVGAVLNDKKSKGKDKYNYYGYGKN